MKALALFLILSTLLGIVALPSNARMVEGRPTLPSDCTKEETWVVDHPKATPQGSKEWSSHCRILKNAKTSKARKFWSSKILP